MIDYNIQIRCSLNFQLKEEKLNVYASCVIDDLLTIDNKHDDLLKYISGLNAEFLGQTSLDGANCQTFIVYSK